MYCVIQFKLFNLVNIFLKLFQVVSRKNQIFYKVRENIFTFMYTPYLTLYGILVSEQFFVCFGFTFKTELRPLAPNPTSIAKQ